jgi:cytochrome P450
MTCPIPPKPKPRPDRVSFWRYLHLFRRDILSAQPGRLYRARMADFRTPFFRSFTLNEPELWRRVLTERPADFPKSDRVRAGLEPLLGRSVFVTNGAEWERQRRIIDPAFEGGRLRDILPAMWEAGRSAVARLSEGEREIEAETSHAAADVIFRTLFSVPIEDATAAAVFRAFRTHQAAQPILNPAALVPLPRWFPRLHRPATIRSAREIRRLITEMTEKRAAQIAAGTAPDDLATKIMTMADPQTGARFATDEMVDQVAIFFLAGHETSASALAWTLYLVALDPEVQDRLADEAAALGGLTGPPPDLGVVSGLRLARDVFREALRLYPPVPMMVREALRPDTFRDRPVAPGDQIVISPWFLGRHALLWQDPDAFCPGRWATEAGRAAARDGFIPFSTGPRVCPGAGFAMIEGPLLLAMLVRAFRFAPVPDRVPEPVAQLTVRARNGIFLRLTHRA